jgi:hypothetical protein
MPFGDAGNIQLVRTRLRTPRVSTADRWAMIGA